MNTCVFKRSTTQILIKIYQQLTFIRYIFFVSSLFLEKKTKEKKKFGTLKSSIDNFRAQFLSINFQ